MYLKRYIHRSVNYNELLLELEIEVNVESSINCSSILDVNDPAFFDFESSILGAFELHDFELIDSYKSEYPDSLSQYYVYAKTNSEGTKLKIFLKVRVSDHIVPDRLIRGELSKHKDKDLSYTYQEAKNYASDKYNQKRGFKARPLDIIFNDDHYISYEQALRAVEDKLDEFDSE